MHDIEACEVIKMIKQQEEDSGALWAIDISQDDKVLVVGSEDSHLTYYTVKSLIHSEEDNLESLTESQKCTFAMC